MSQRPELTLNTDPLAFAEHYWLRDELAGFCRANGLPTFGSKEEISARILALLAGKAQPSVQRRTSRKSTPNDFTRETPVGPGWHCSEALRAFIATEIGRPFRFDRFMREQIGAGSGAPLGAVINAWRKQEGRRHEIEPQFEFNRFTRQYRAHAPNAAHVDVVAAWKRYRDLPSSKRPSVEQMAREDYGSS